MSASIYRDHASIYATFAESSLPNAIYDRPAILRLAGDLTGKRVLELGCAAGGLTQQLVEHGANVLALDREQALIQQARQRVFSIHHPITGWELSDHRDYHRTEMIYENGTGTEFTSRLACIDVP